ncbi:hypothetical protein JLT2_70 [Paraglaciecola Antarctic JLT virus 2]|nr:hypothetical protein JLT2_70 [Paraglaciecola Antarctic JLT virus 2]
MPGSIVLRLDSVAKTFAVDKAPPYNYTINYSDGSSANHEVRFFTPLSRAGSQSYTLDSDISLPNDFIIKQNVVFNPSSENSFYQLCGKTSGFKINFFGNNFSNNSLSNAIEFDNFYFTNALVGMDRAKLNEISFVRVGTSLSLFINEAQVGSSVTYTRTPIVATYGTGNVGFAFFDGDLSDLFIDKASTIVLNAPLNRQYTAAAPTVTNKADSSNNLTAVNLNNAGQAFTLNAAGTIYTGADGTTTIEVA